MKRNFNIPLGATIRVKRENGLFETYVFRGTDDQGVIYEDPQEVRHSDIGGYVEISIKTTSGWKVL